MEIREKIILALDTESAGEAWKILDILKEDILNVKVGPALFIREGPKFIENLQKKNFRVFLDLKLHDIPNTVLLGARAAKELGVWMLSVHLSGGIKMLTEAVKESDGKLVLAGVTVLTSLDQNQIEEIGFSRPVPEQVKRLAELAVSAKLDAVVASPMELRMIKQSFGNKLAIITPGIRAEGAPVDDQSRTMTARDALNAGADYLVIGRLVLKAPNPKEALHALL